MRDVAIVSFAQSDCMADAAGCSEVQLLLPLIKKVLADAGLTSVQDVDFTCSGSCDYLQGAAFAFVSGVDALGAVPPIKESHVEMDAAWALYESWLKIQTGDIDSALIYGFGKATGGELPTVLSLQLDPYYLSPLGIDAISMAALQARSMLNAGVIDKTDMAQVVVDSRTKAKNNPHALLSGDVTIQQLLQESAFISPLHKHDCCPVTDGAAAMLICSVEKASQWNCDFALIKGIDHRIETHYPGLRDLTQSASTTLAAQNAGIDTTAIEVAELYAPFSHQQIILQRALGLCDTVDINSAGGIDINGRWGFVTPLISIPPAVYWPGIS